MTDAELVSRVLNGSPVAFTELADRHTAAGLRFASRMLGNRDDAEDATQDALLRAYRGLGTFDNRLSFRTWYFSILVNRCRTALSSRAKRARWVVVDADSVARAASPAQASNSDLRVELQRALERLLPDQREAFLLKHVEQLEYTEMSRITGVRVSALKMRVQRACLRLQEDLREYNDG